MAIRKILVVDDSKTELYHLSEMLGKRGYQVRTAENGEEAMRRLAEDKPDLILSALKGHLVGPKIDFTQPGRTIHVPTSRCPFATAYARARDLRPVKVDLNTYAERDVWTFYDEGSGSVIVDATTCEIDGANRPPKARPESPGGDLVWE
jgi:CheY-like chemotaxis protein